MYLPFTDFTVIADLLKLFEEEDEELNFLFFEPTSKILLVAFLP